MEGRKQGSEAEMQEEMQAGGEEASKEGGERERDLQEADRRLRGA
jgi:hypothetical protein